MCVYNIQLANDTHKMRFNISKGSSNDYLASVFLQDPSDSTFTPEETVLYLGQKVEIESKKKSQFFTIVIYPISSNPGDFLIETKWTNGFPWWGILLIVFFGTLFLVLILLLILVVIILIVRAMKSKGGNNSRTHNGSRFNSVDRQ